MKILNTWALIILSVAGATYGAGYFTIIGPQTHQLGKPYRAHLVANGYRNPREIEVSLSHPDYRSAIKTFSLINDLEEEFSIDFLATTNISTLILKAKYTDDPGTVSEQTIKVITKKFSVLIQTDKAIYKPGDKVQFRVIVLDADLKPHPYSSLNIAFSDGSKQRVTTRKASQSEFGVYEDSLQLADEANFGKWAILVVVDGKTNDIYKQNFEVVNYQLPQFEVVVDVNAKDVLLSGGKIEGKVSAKYPFANGAKFVKGKATLTASMHDPEYPQIVMSTKSFSTSGAGDEKRFAINVRDLNLNGQSNKTIVKLEATFTDDLTKRSLVGSTNVTVHKTSDYTIEIVEGKKFMLPGESYRLKLKVKSYDGKEVLNRRLKIQIALFEKLNKCSRLDGSKNQRRYSRTALPDKFENLADGGVEVSLKVPSGSEAILFRFSFDKEFIAEYKVNRQFTKSGQNLDIVVASSLKHGKEVNVNVRSTEGLTKLHSVVIGRNGIVHSQSDNVRGTTNSNIKFFATSPMLPSSKLIVYYIQTSGEVVYDQVELKFDTWTGNSISINAPTSAEPNDEVDVSIQSSPDSFVGLMAVDRRSSLLATGNDIDESKLQSEIDLLTFSDVFNKSKANDLYSFLGEANAVILTDADKGAYDCTLVRLGERESAHNDQVDDIPSSSRNIRSADHDSPSNEIPETWIFKSGITDGAGNFNLREIVPETLTSFVVSAFSIHPELGFGLAKPQNIGVFRDFFLKVNLPSSAFVDDVIKVEVFVFNYAATSPKTKIKVALLKNGAFEILNARPRACNLELTNEFEKTIEVVQNGVAKTNFFIKPKKAGSLEVEVTTQLGTQSAVTGSQNILIEETGLKDGKVKAKLFDLRKREHDSVYFNMPSSSDAAEGSEQLEAFVSGNVMGSGIRTSISGSDGTTGEKILNYVAAAHSLQYLKATGQNEKIQQALPTVEAGYQFVLSRKLSGSNRGYTANAGDTTPSLEATSQVAKFLAIIKDFSPIQDVNIVSALEFLKVKQTKAGEFVIKNAETVSGSPAEEVAKTALIALAFLENAPYVQRYKSTIQKSLSFISSNFDDAKDDEYALAISAYALASFGELEDATKFLDELLKTSHMDKDYIFWNGTTSSQQISTAAYAILTLVKLERVVEAPKILNWLLTKRQEDGGFQSSEDTVVGIQAVAAMAVHFHSDLQDMNLYIYNENLFKKIQIQINKNYKPQTYPIPTPSGATVNANGTGTAFVQMTSRYYVRSAKSDKFSVTVRPQAAENSFKLTVCIQRSSGKSDSVVAEVKLPVGYEFNDNIFDKTRVKSVHTRKNKSLVVLTLDKVSRSPYCVDINAVSFYAVSSATPLDVKVYDQNDKDRYDVKFYSPPASNICQWNF